MELLFDASEKDSIRASFLILFAVSFIFCFIIFVMLRTYWFLGMKEDVPSTTSDIFLLMTFVFWILEFVIGWFIYPWWAMQWGYSTWKYKDHGERRPSIFVLSWVLWPLCVIDFILFGY